MTTILSLPVKAPGAILEVKTPIRIATTGPGFLGTAFAAGQIIDGLVLQLNDRILIKDQTSAKENGIYIVTSGAPQRAPDFNESGEVLAGISVFVTEGVLNADTGWVVTSDGAISIDVDDIVFGKYATATGSGGSINNIIQDNTSVAVTDTGSNGTIVLTTENIEAMRITNDQKIGIGAIPSHKLVVQDTLDQLKIAYNDNKYYSLSTDINTNFYVKSPTNTVLQASSSGVGIGAVPTNIKLHVVNPSGADQLRIGYNTSKYLGINVDALGNVVFSSTGNTINLGNMRMLSAQDPISPQDLATKNYVDSISGGGFPDKIENGNSKVETSASETIIFTTQNIQRMLVDSSGNFGINTAPNAKLDVVAPNNQFRLGTDAANYTTFSSGIGGAMSISPVFAGSVLTIDTVLSVNNNKITNLGTPTNASDAATKLYVDSITAGTSANSIAQLDSNIIVTDTGTNGLIVFTTDSIEKMRIDSNGKTQINGNTSHPGRLTVVDPSEAQITVANTTGGTNVQLYADNPGNFNITGDATKVLTTNFSTLKVGNTPDSRIYIHDYYLQNQNGLNIKNGTDDLIASFADTTSIISETTSGNTTTNILNLTHKVDGTPLASHGMAINYNAEITSGVFRDIGRTSYVITNTTTESSKMTISLLKTDTTLAEALSLESGTLSISNVENSTTFTQTLSNTNLTLTGATNIDVFANLTLQANAILTIQDTGSINMNTAKIANLGDPTLSTDAVNKQYLDGAIGSISQSSIFDNDTSIILDDSLNDKIVFNIDNGQVAKIDNLGKLTTISVDILTTADQLRIGNSVSNYWNFDANASGTLTLTPVGGGASQFILDGSLNLSGNRIQNVADPTSAQDVATRNYVDSKANLVSNDTNITIIDSDSSSISMTVDAQEALLINSSQSVGIGTNVIGAKLVVVSVADQFRIGNSSANYWNFSAAETGTLRISQTGGTGTKQVLLQTQLDMDGNTITDLGAPSLGSDAATKSYVDSKSSLVANDTTIILTDAASGNISFTTDGMEKMTITDKISSVKTDILDTSDQLRLGNDISNYWNFNTNATGSLTLNQTGGTGVKQLILNHMLDMSNNKIQNVVDPANLQDVATKNYVDIKNNLLQGNSSIAVTDSGSGNISLTTDGQEALIVDSSQNIGIGANPVNAKLEIISTGDILRLGRTDSLAKTFAISATGKMTVSSLSGTDNTIRMESTNGNYSTEFQISNTSNAFVMHVGNESANRFYINTSTTEAKINTGSAYDIAMYPKGALTGTWNSAGLVMASTKKISQNTPPVDGNDLTNKTYVDSSINAITQIVEGDTGIEVIDSGSNGVVLLKTDNIERLRVKSSTESGNISINGNSTHPGKVSIINTGVQLSLANAITGENTQFTSASNGSLTINTSSSGQTMISNFSTFEFGNSASVITKHVLKTSAGSPYIQHTANTVSVMDDSDESILDLSLVGNEIKVEDTAVGDVSNILRIKHKVIGTPTDNIGSGLVFSTETSASNFEDIGVLEFVATDTTATSEDAVFKMKLMSAGNTATEAIKMDTTGVLTLTNIESNVSSTIKTLANGNIEFNSGGVFESTTELDMNNNKIVNLADPTVASDASTKAYVDSKQDSVQSGGSKIQASSAGDERFRFEVDSAPVAVINNTGNIGLGNSNPDTKLSVVDSSNQMEMGVSSNNKWNFSASETGSLTLSQTGGTGVKQVVFAQKLNMSSQRITGVITDATSLATDVVNKNYVDTEIANLVLDNITSNTNSIVVTDADNTLRFSTGGVENARMLSSGDFRFGNIAPYTMFVDVSASRVGIGTETPITPLDINIDDTVNNDITNMLSLIHTTSGTPANGIGTGVRFSTETTDGTREVGNIAIKAINVGSGTENSQFDLDLIHNSVVGNVLSMDNTGTFSIKNIRDTKTCTIVPGSTGTTITPNDSKLIVSGVLDMNTNKITNLVNPTSAQEAATKAYVDAQAFNSVLTVNDSSISIVDTGPTASYINFIVDGTETARYQDDQLGVGTTTPGARIDVFKSGSGQFRISYDASNYASMDVDSSGNLTIVPNQANGTIGFGSKRLVSVADPTSAQDVATKNYIDTQLAGFSDTFVQDGDTLIQITDNGASGSFIRFQVDSVEAGRFLDDKFGLGIASPTTKLHVVDSGNQMRSGYDASNYVNFSTNSTGTTTISSTGTSPEITFSGIVNTDTPTASAHVATKGYVDSQVTGFIVDTIVDSDTDVTVNDASSAGKITFNVDGMTVGRFASNGKFGIGSTISPGSKLEVIDGSGDDQMRLGVSASNYWSFNVTPAGSLTLSQTGGTGTQQVMFGHIVNMGMNKITNMANPTLDTDAATKFYVDDRFINFDDNRIVDGDGKITVVDSTNTIEFQVNSNEVARFKDSDFGIGTTSPDTRLHVVSTTDQLRLGYDASNYLNFGVSSTGIATIGATGTNAGLVFSNNLVVNGTVDTGTNSVSSTFVPTSDGHLANKLYVDSQITSNINTHITNSHTHITDTDTSIVVDDATANAKIVFNVDNGEVARFSDNSNFGVGVSGIPNAKIESLSTTDQLRLSYDASNYTKFVVGSDGLTTLTSVGTGAGVTIANNLIVSGSINSGSINSGSNSVSSTFVPTAGGHLTNKTYVDTEIGNISTSSILDSDSSVVIDDATAAAKIVFNVDGGEIARFSDNGNFGIGVSSAPNAKLEVLGTSDQLRIGNSATNYWNFTTTTTGSLTLSQTGGTGTKQLALAHQMDMSSNKIINVTDPTAAQDVATKAYVDAQGGGGGSADTLLNGNNTLTLGSGTSSTLVLDIDTNSTAMVIDTVANPTLKLNSTTANRSTILSSDSAGQLTINYSASSVSKIIGGSDTLSLKQDTDTFLQYDSNTKKMSICNLGGTDLSGSFVTISNRATGTDTALEVLRINAHTTGTPSSGLGSSLAFGVENSNNDTLLYGQVDLVLDDVTAATATSSFRFRTSNNGTLGATGSAITINSDGRILNVTDPSSAQDVATKAYADSVTPKSITDVGFNVTVNDTTDLITMTTPGGSNPFRMNTNGNVSLSTGADPILSSRCEIRGNSRQLVLSTSTTDYTYWQVDSTKLIRVYADGGAIITKDYIHNTGQRYISSYNANLSAAKCPADVLTLAHSQVYDAGVSDVLSFRSVSTAHPSSVGFGQSIRFDMEFRAGEMAQWAGIEAVSTSTTSSSEAVELRFRTATGGSLVASGSAVTITGDKKISNVTDPTSAQDVGTKTYIDTGDASDARIKKDMTPIDTSESLDRVNSLVVVDYKFKEDIDHKADKKSDADRNEEDSEDKKVHRGVIAQQVEEIIPGAVRTGNGFDIDDLKLLNTNDLIGELIGAVQTLSKLVDTLSEKTKNLEEENTKKDSIIKDLQSRLEELEN